ncbi:MULTISPECIES: hypothetical protein [unclassified Paenibacillus]|uniref:hypothetical protein n=1 Tax=unclassified Paenibacillus TaxID=185978 RepID=UPI0024058AA1|nr:MULTISPECIES: hypothetical protein [unclassified Paenibacillus]MDF9844942.1 hypothetical protein [Paenibacillus sp. PastF-2]MDF9851526.1 hypothetical protein [Paenibacillus sp. PastM-2]MDF9858110.1 hypothetical protein [Paenibacillus sp. PastF-1]MDH6483421.1 hypothetical protein [Paenibacillus sp. PastH-2]MDH6510786.1 hypothetical protein [Paenibacillus sp. PastM-3]
MDDLWMAFVYPGSFFCLLGVVLLIIGYNRRRSGRRTGLEGVAAKPGPPAPGGPGAALSQQEAKYFLIGGILLGIGVLLLALLGLTSLFD